ncbi:MAG: nitrilase-related carbon-nitrogen hydrolase [bacterium]
MNIAIASWLAPVFLIRFSRSTKPLFGFLVILIVNSIITSIIWKQLIPIEGPPYYVINVVGSIFTALAYLIDRIFIKKNSGFISTLIFPMISVVFGFLHISTSLYGANGSLAITQDNLALLQILSITGMWGIIFLVTWFGPFINWLWERKFKFEEIYKGAVIYLALMLTVFLFGIVRLTFFKPDSQTIRIASISSKIADPDIPQKNESWELFRNASYEKQLKTLDLSEKAVCAGAKIVTWREGEIYLLKDDELNFVKSGCKLADSLNIYLGMSIASFTKDFPNKLAENKIVWIDTTGDILFEYLKALPTPTEKCIAGDGKVKTLNYPQSKIASTICFDLDFPSFIRKFGDSGLDIMLSPANDWYAISRTHPPQVSFRAIENGFSLVRPNSNYGLAAAYDYQGRIISSLNYSKTKNEIMISDVPEVGVKTIYNIIGDLFAWLCSFSIVILFTKIFIIDKRKKKKYKRINVNPPGNGGQMRLPRFDYAVTGK